MMDKDFIEYVYARCNKVLVENEEYAKMQNDNTDPDLLEAKAEELCYMQGWKDAVKMLMGSLN